MIRSSMRRGMSRGTSGRVSRGRKAIRSAIETLETRVMLTTVTYTVQTSSDTVASIVAPSGANAFNANTLRAAVNAANSQPFAAVIQFNAAKFTGGAANTITLTSGLTLGPVAPAGTHTYKLVGPTAKPITISGAATYTDFTIANGVSAEFDTLTIAHGVATNTGSDGDIDGGGIYSSGPLTLVGDTFASNTATDEGGAVYSNTGLITVNKTTFTANSADYGGAIYINGTNSATAPTITASTFTSNIAGGNGGAVYFYDTVSGTITISTSTFTGNTAEEGSGGAVLIDSELNNDGDTITTTISGSTFTGDTAGSNGGAVDSDGTTLNITNDTFNNDKVAEGSGGAIDSGDDTLTVTGSHFTGDSSPEDGGAIGFGTGRRHHRHNGGTTLTVSNSTFTNCSATDGQGGAIADEVNNIQGDSTLTVTASTFTGDKAADGGGAIVDDDFGSGMANLVSESLTSDTFTGDSTSNGNGGAVLAGVSSLTANSDTFSNDSAGNGSGGGLYAFAKSFTATNSNFTGDTAAINGGGLWINGQTAVLSNCKFTGDSALNDGQEQDGVAGVTPADGSGLFGNDAGLGGGIYDEADTMTITGTTFLNDSANAGGGGIFGEGATLVIGTSAFTTNSAPAGGGMVFEGITATVTNSSFTGNSATTDDGGGIYVFVDYSNDGSDSSLTLNVTGDTFTNNTAAGSGGGISFYFENDGSAGGGGDMGGGGGGNVSLVTPLDDSSVGELNINQSTFTSNSAFDGGGAVYAEAQDSGDNLDIFNSTFNGNSTSFDGGGAVYAGVTTAQIANDTFYGNAAGNDVGGGGLYIHLDDEVTVTDSTFDSNSAGFGLGGGIGIGTAENADVILDGDIVAGNLVTGTPGTDNDLEGAYSSASADNIIGDGSFNQTGFTVGNVNGNFVGTNLNPINPMLAPLANNGGPTQTQIPSSTSLAIGNSQDFPVYDPSNNDVTLVDQTGLNTRPQDQGYDIGAYQTGNAPVVTTPTVSIAAPATVHVPSSGSTTVKIPVTLSSTATSAIVLKYSTLGGTATSANGDYGGVTNATFTIPKNSAAGTYFITIAGIKHVTTHGTYPKNFQVTLLAATNATVVGGTETVTVTLAFP